MQSARGDTGATFATSSFARTRRRRYRQAPRSEAFTTSTTTRRCGCWERSIRPSASPREIATSGEAPYSFTRFARVRFLLAEEHALDLYWLDGYGGGLYLCFADATSGTETYGAGRYLLDTVKGSDLGERNGKLVLDFNFAYNPSCSYDPRWVCPLAPPGNRLKVPIRGGERAS